MEDETAQSYCARTVGVARDMWKQKMRLPLLTELIAKTTWRAEKE